MLMSECAFHPQNHATAELNVRDPVVDGQIAIPICDDCVEQYDKVQARYLKEGSGEETNIQPDKE